MSIRSTTSTAVRLNGGLTTTEVETEVEEIEYDEAGRIKRRTITKSKPKRPLPGPYPTNPWVPWSPYHPYNPPYKPYYEWNKIYCGGADTVVNF